MIFYDVADKTTQISFKKAVLEGFNAETGGVFMPSEFIKLSASTIYRNPPPSFRDLAFEIIRSFCNDEIPDSDLMPIIAQFFPYKIPVNPLNQTTYLIELFHGPTCNYKDIGTCFFAYLLEYFNKDNSKPVNVILPASGERACAVGCAVSQVKGVNSIILYPENSLNELQKQQISEHGKNVYYISIKGSFADCEKITMKALKDSLLQDILTLVPGGNDMNIAALLIQSVFFVYASLVILYRCGFDNKIENPSIIASVPSGSFSNIVSGLIAKRMGAPICGFISAENENHALSGWLKAGVCKSKSSLKTNTPALDIPNPLNFKRMQEIYPLSELRNYIVPCKFDDEETIKAVQNCYEKTGYIIDPYGGMAWQAWKDVIDGYSLKHKKSKSCIYSCAKDSLIGMVLQTSHPAKFADIMKKAVGRTPSLPDRLNFQYSGEKNVEEMEADYEVFKDWLISNLGQ